MQKIGVHELICAQRGLLLRGVSFFGLFDQIICRCEPRCSTFVLDSPVTPSTPHMDLQRVNVIPHLASRCRIISDPPRPGSLFLIRGNSSVDHEKAPCHHDKHALFGVVHAGVGAPLPSSKILGEQGFNMGVHLQSAWREAEGGAAFPAVAKCVSNASVIDKRHHLLHQVRIHN